ncbi:unnamed protein product [Closterium sp. NIES-53]
MCKSEYAKQRRATADQELSSMGNGSGGSNRASTSTVDPPPPARRSRQRDIRDMTDTNAQNRLDYLWAATVAENDLAFNVSKSKSIQAFVDAAVVYGKAYNLPTPYKVSGLLLDKLKADTEDLVRPMKESWKTSGCTLSVDGWTCIKPRGMGAMMEVGPKHIVQVVIDNASNNKTAANNLRSKYPHVVFTNCAAHCLDLMLHDLGNIPAVKRVLGQVHRVVMMVKGSASAAILFHELFSKLSLVRPGATRFGTQVIMLGRFLEVKRALRAMVISEEWEVAVARTEEGMEVRKLLLDDVCWDCRTAVLRLMTPIYEVLRAVDTRAQVMGLIYGLMLEATVKTIEYHRGEGRLGSDDARWAARTLVEGGRMTDAEWWCLFGGEVQALQEQAVMGLSQPVTSSEVERYRSALQRVQRRDRNRLTAKKMTDVTIVAFTRRARGAFDQKAAVRARLYADLGNGTLKEECAIIPAESEDEEGEAEEEEEPMEEECTIDWSEFGNIGRKRKGKAGESSKEKKGKGIGSCKGKGKGRARDEEEEEEAADSSGEEEEPAWKNPKGRDAWDCSDGSSGVEEEDEEEDDEEEEDE